MSLSAADLDGDWAVFDNLRSVTYTPFVPATDGPGTPVANISAFVVGHSKHEVDADGGGRIHREAAVYHLRASQLGATVVTKRGTITDTTDGTVWVVESADYQSWGTRVRCEVVRY